MGDQDEEEEAREVVHLLELLLELEELSVEVEEAHHSTHLRMILQI